MSLPKVLRRERFYIPSESISVTQQEAIERRFTKQLYNESNCAKCEYLHDRPSETCDTCPSNLGEYKLYGERMFKDVPYTGIPQSASKFLNKHFDLEEFNVIDRRPQRAFKHDIEFTGKLRAEQTEAFNVLVDTFVDDGGCGTLEAPPRSGKCVSGNTMIVLPSGPVRIDSLFDDLILSADYNVEDVLRARNISVLAPNGKFEDVSFLYTKVVDTTIEIVLEDGSRLRGTHNHPIGVYLPGVPQYQWLELKDVYLGSIVACRHSMSSRIVSIETIHEPIRVYDICVPGPHSFYGNGIVNHNTVMATAFMCKMKQKVLILAKQQDWLDQFYETMCGSESQKPLTNIPDIEKFVGKRIAGMCKTISDFKRYDICLATYQTFLSDNGKLKHSEIRDMFPMIIVDECLHPETQVITRVGSLTMRTLVSMPRPPHVLSKNVETGELSFQKIISSNRSVHTKLINLTIEGEVFRCSLDHLWYSNTRRCWIHAKDIEVGEDICSCSTK